MGTAIKRYAILFNPSLPERDLVAAEHRSMTRELQPLLLDKMKFDAVYRLDDECRAGDVRPDVVCLPPTADSLQKVVKELKEKHHVGSNAFVYTSVLGHGDPNFLGGRVRVRNFAAALNGIPAEVSRATVMHQCHAGAFAALGLVDENDLLWAYSSGEEVNVTGPANYAVLFSEDRNGDGTVSFQEMLWASQGQIYNTLAPFYRHFVFRQGPGFVDRGLGTEPARPPFPDRLVMVPDIPTYLKLTKQGARQGVTVIGFDMRSSNESLMGEMELAAGRYKGFVQFLWLPPDVARKAMKSQNENYQWNYQNFFELFYIGSDPDLSFTSPGDVEKVLARLFAGEDLKGRKK